MNAYFLKYLQTYRLVMQHKKVRIVLIVTSAVAIVLLVLPWLLNTAGRLQYNAKSYQNAQTVWQAASFVSVYEQDIPLANKAAALYQQNMYEQAAATYEKALSKTVAIRECQIRFNYAKTQEKIGDNLEKMNATEAIRSYAKGINLVSGETCLQSSEHGAKTKKLLEELTKKANDLSKKEREKQSRPKENEEQQEEAKDQEEREEQRKKEQTEYINNQQLDKRQEEAKKDPSSYYEKRVW